MIVFGMVFGLGLAVCTAALAFLLSAIFNPHEVNDEDIWKD